jgi:hypothetical protein
MCTSSCASPPIRSSESGASRSPATGTTARARNSFCRAGECVSAYIR